MPWLPYLILSAFLSGVTREPPRGMQKFDWDPGNLVALWLFPDDGVIWNTWDGITTLLQDGDLLLGGFFAVKRFNVGHLD